MNRFAPYDIGGNFTWVKSPAILKSIVSP